MQAVLGRRATSALCFAGLTASYASEQALQVTSWVKYPGSSTTSVIAGALYINHVAHDDGNTTHQLTWKLTGTDDWCGNGTESGNVCGIHVHVGKDCADAGTIGGHLYSSDIADPWAPVRYTSDGGVSTQAVRQSVNTGLTTGDLLKRVVIVHNSVGAGERIACGIATAVSAVSTIPKTQRLAVKTWVKYPGSTYAGNVSGTVTVVPISAAVVDAVALSWDLKGTDDACSTGSGNVCGIHIHEGKTCASAAEVGGHYYDKVAISTDPWTSVRYSSTAGVAVSADFSTQVVTGTKRSSMIGRVVVVHSSVGAGERIACGILVDAVDPAGNGGNVTTTAVQQSGQVSLAYGVTHISGMALMLVASLLQF